MPVGGGGGERRGPTAAGREQCTRPGRAAGNGGDPAAPLSALLSFSPSFLWPLLHPYVCLSVVSPRILFTVSLSLFDPVLPFVFLSRFWFRFFLSACLSPPPPLFSLLYFSFSFFLSRFLSLSPSPPSPSRTSPLLHATHPPLPGDFTGRHARIPTPRAVRGPPLAGWGDRGPWLWAKPPEVAQGPKEAPSPGCPGTGSTRGGRG